MITLFCLEDFPLMYFFLRIDKGLLLMLHPKANSNDELRSCLGHNKLENVVDDNGVTCVRDEVPIAIRDKDKKHNLKKLLIL